MLDVSITGGSVVDGTGAPAMRADVGIRDGRIVAIGDLDEPARERIDADGLMLAPGFVDPHTHYDAQLFWDPTASPSSLHGVTTVIGGNCGFSLAPLGTAEDADYIRRMMAVVEGMSLEALEQGIDWDWSGFGEYLDRLEGGIGVNAGFLVGHCALRRGVMGAAAVEREATPEELRDMEALLHASLDAGGLGFSTSRSFTHRDGDGAPVPSRAASVDETLALARVLSRHEGTSLEFITDGCLNGLNDAEARLMADLSLAAERPLNWNVFTIDSREPELYARQLAASDAAAARGARVVALTMPVLVRLTMSFLTYSPIHQLPGWREVLSLPVRDRMRRLRDPEVRERLLAGARSPEAGVFARVADFARFEIGETFSPGNEGLTGRLVGDIALERGVAPFDALVDIVLEDDLRTVLWPQPPDADAASWSLREQAWRHPHTLLGGSDAGAHLDRMCGAPYTTEFLRDCLHGRKLVPVERAVQALTDDPARLFGLRGRGRLAVGYQADVVLLDPACVGNGPVHFVNDLPGGAARLHANATGVERVLVNGRTSVRAGKASGDLPGTLLRSGVHTETPSLAV
jgi:N-acyl-D-aspartate/D-glutamate deacylase